MADVVVDSVERELGITTYLCPEVPGFSAVLKARYSDFVVHEVGSDGAVARLTCLEPRLVTDPPLDGTAEGPEAAAEPVAPAATASEDAPGDRKRMRDEDGAEEEKETPEKNRPEPDWARLEPELAGFVGLEAATAAVTFLRKIEQSKGKAGSDEKDQMDGNAAPQYHVVMPPMADKEQRRALHQWVREHLSGIARSDTIDDDQNAAEKIIRIWHEQFTKYMPNWKAFEKHRNRPGQGRPQVSKPPPGKRFLRFVLYKENMDTTHAVNQLARVPALRGRPLRMGYAGMKDKRGVTSQFVTVPAHTPLHSLTRWNVSQQQHRGGGHTRNQGVGVLRVGNFEYVEEDLRMGRLQGNRFDVALRNVQLDGLSLRDMKERLGQVALSLKENGFINYFGVQRFGKFHDTHLTGIEVLKENYSKAIDIIMQPKPNEAPFVTTARETWQNRFQDTDDKEATEKDHAEKFVRNLNRNLNNSEVSVLHSLAKHPLDYKRAYGCIQKTMRMMFLHAVQSYLWNHVASFRIDVLGRTVVKGDMVQGQTDDRFDVHIVTDDDISSNRYKLQDVLIPLIGTRTQDPANEAGELFDKLLKKLGLSRADFQKLDEREFDLSGDYRNLICPSAELDFKIIEYTDPLQPLIQTDLMKLHGIEVEEASNHDPQKVLLAMDVGFTLPSSTYATIALRELMKRPTSSEYQSELKLEN